MRESQNNSLSRCVRGSENGRERERLGSSPSHPKAEGHESGHEDQEWDRHVRGRSHIRTAVGQDHLALLFPRPTSLGGLAGAGTPLGCGQLRRPSRSALDPSKMPARNRSRVLLADRLGGSLTSRKVHDGLGALVEVTRHRGSVHVRRIAGRLCVRASEAGFKLSHCRGWGATARSVEIEPLPVLGYRLNFQR
jgi:hypothetical protein